MKAWIGGRLEVVELSQLVLDGNHSETQVYHSRPQLGMGRISDCFAGYPVFAQKYRFGPSLATTNMILNMNFDKKV